MPIEINGLCKSFDGKQVLQGLNCRFPDGQITCICGSSGCGKTTLLRILMGFTQADDGMVTGIDRSRLSAVFQEDRLIPHLSAAENIRLVLPRGYSPESVPDALATVGLKDAAQQPASTLSGGMKRRVALVRALLHPAPLVLMDEPFKGLDDAARQLTISFARKMLKNRTALVVTHDLRDAEELGASVFHLPLIQE